MSANYLAQAEAIFRRMLSRGRPVAFEDAARAVATPDGVDRRCFGSIPARLRRDGLICPAGFKLSEIARHNHGIKRLWILADAVKGGAQ